MMIAHADSEDEDLLVAGSYEIWNGLQDAITRSISRWTAPLLVALVAAVYWFAA